MKCDEPIFKDGEDFSYRDCQLDLGHSGAHEYFGEKLPRPEPSGTLDPEISDMFERIARERRIWDLDERTFKVVFEVTTVYAVDVTAESEDAALRMYEDLTDLPDFSSSYSHAIDGSADVRRIDKYERSGFTGAPFGPRIACPDCGAEAMHRSWLHNPYRKCHGPIEWRESAHARDLRWRYSREYKHTPELADAARKTEAVAA